jgi:hypothetical protein
MHFACATTLFCLCDWLTKSKCLCAPFIATDFIFTSLATPRLGNGSGGRLTYFVAGAAAALLLQQQHITFFPFFFFFFFFFFFVPLYL